MRAMVLREVVRLDENTSPLSLTELPIPNPGQGEVLIRVHACGVCHTELDEIEGRTPPGKLPLIPGHQVVGKVVQTGAGIHRFHVGDRVGVAWIFNACGRCEFCRSGRENLCDDFQATGRDADGGYAEYMIAKENFTYSIPEVYSNSEAAPLLCAGAIGYRSLRLAGIDTITSLGLMGFGASAHLVIKLVRQQYPKVKVYVFARSEAERAFALKLGAAWSGDIGHSPPVKPQSIIDTTPAWKPVVASMEHLRKGGRLVINAIRKESADRHNLENLSYENHLWHEKEIKSVANITALDVREFLAKAGEADIRPDVKEYPLEDANQALSDIRNKEIRGAKVLLIS
jgi:propanol-preferring alcohol dehydrogenase